MKEARTQVQAAREGRLTAEIAAVARSEQLDPEVLRQRVARGLVVIPANRRHAGLVAAGIGAGLRTKVNANLGVSPESHGIDLELAKLDVAMRLGVDAVMDLSCAGQAETFRKHLLQRFSGPVGTVPAYDILAYAKGELADVTPADWLAVLEQHARQGVDFVTVHAGLTRAVAARLRAGERKLNIVSRGGSLLFAWMAATGLENPYYASFDRVLEVCAEYDVTISLGDACRPGCLHDATDDLQIAELLVLGELTQKAREAGVQVMVEGPGHVPMDQVVANVLLAKRLCHGAPFYVLGPLVTDVAPGYDHITSAIGGAMAAAAGADFICYVTPAEHLRLPTIEDVREGVVAARIAAHAADIAKGLAASRAWDERMAIARRSLDWATMFSLALDPEKPQRYRQEALPQSTQDTCTMCGSLCAVRTMNECLARVEWGQAGLKP
ncbi:MAG: phosphomethylpyrimidine synthase ThiC [Anaerolineae bacterium]